MPAGVGASVSCPPGQSDPAYCTQNVPTATTLDASGISGSGATLNGIANPNGAPTAWTFQYGTSTNYGSTTPVGQLPGDSTSHTVSSSLSGLQPATTYHFRLVTHNSGGFAMGADHTFTTSSPIGASERITKVSVPKRVRRGKAFTVSFRLSVAARVTITIRKGKRATGRTRISARAGSNHVRLKASRKAGRYTVEIVAKPARGTSASVRRSLRVR
ncbi:MAG TPA: hypothetical protein VGN69_02205 [Solirubrobacteraceae bacterium]|nr:hypothetical protein [Solirubrobacteraceae bacterium]